MKKFAIISLIVITGCAYSMRVSVPEFEKEIRIIAETPEDYAILVIREYGEPMVYRFSSNGTVTIQVPETPRACDRLLFGVINLGGSGAPEIYVIKDSRTISELTPYALYRHSSEKGGSYELKVE